LNREEFLEKRRRLKDLEIQPRVLCVKCWQPNDGCYCFRLKPFDPGIRFVILIHPIERRRRIASGRMSHLMLENSRLIAGEDFSQSNEIDRIIRETNAMILYPGPTSLDLGTVPEDRKSALFDGEKDLTIFVIDGTWSTARKMIRSRNLVSLPRVSFSLDRSSRFGRVRKQPAPGCFSTIEAIHQTIELLGDVKGFDVKSRLHDGLLDVFDAMVERQLGFIGVRPRHGKFRETLKERD
jgi:DTW domain-containing protein YfiP